MKKGDHIFVYGTLRIGQRADLSRKSGVVPVGPDRINGSLYALGWFPGVKLSGEDFNDASPAVVGDVFVIEDESITHVIDLYEGHPGFFMRKPHKTEQGRTAWVYEYQGDIAYAATEIPSGDWLERIKECD